MSKRISRRDFMRNVGAAAVTLAVSPQERAEAAAVPKAGRPNILFYFPDTHRRQALGFTGEDPVVTPNIDRLASEGMVFTNACGNHPVCSPYRAMLMTGKYPCSNGVIANCNSAFTKYGAYLRESERCISDVLYDAGYHTGYIGKWHLDAPDAPDVDDWRKGVWDAYTPPGPKRHHFQFWYSYGCMFDFLHPYFWVGDARKDGKTVVHEWEPTHESSVAIEYIRNRDGKHRDPEKPFALFVAPHPPHSPFELVPEQYLEPYRNTKLADLLNRGNVDLSLDSGPTAAAKKHVRSYFAMVTGVDEQFGRILRCLAEEGLEENTIVVFTSDHGEMLGSHNQMGKSVWYEESMGVPFAIRWTGRIEPGQQDMPLSVPDVMPSLLGLAGLEEMVPGGVEGTDYSDLMLGKSTRTAESAMYIAPGLTPGPGVGRRGLRTRRHLLGVEPGEGGEKYTLFDLEKDPYELRNVADESPSLVKELRRQLDEWFERTNDPWLKT